MRRRFLSRIGLANRDDKGADSGAKGGRKSEKVEFLHLRAIQVRTLWGRPSCLPRFW